MMKQGADLAGRRHELLHRLHRLHRLVPDICTTILIFDDLQGGSICHGVHEAVMDGQDRVLQTWIGLHARHSDTEAFNIIDTNVPIVGFVDGGSSQFIDDILRNTVCVLTFVEHIFLQRLDDECP